MSRKLFHETIFFPSQRDELDQLIRVEDFKELSNVIIVPHGELRSLASLYNSAFSYLKRSERIIILAPLHSETLLRDQDSYIFEDQADLIETPYIGLKLASLGLRDGSHYSKEEHSTELSLLYAAKYMSSASLSIVYTSAKSSEEVKSLSYFITKWNDSHTSFIISSNLTGIIRDSEELNRAKQEAIDSIIKKDGILDKWRKKRLEICGAPIIAAFNKAIKGEWQLAEASQCDRLTGHASFIYLRGSDV